jgi:hypothetical protein
MFHFSAPADSVFSNFIAMVEGASARDDFPHRHQLYRFVEGAWTDAEGDGRMDSLNPASGEMCLK